MKIHTYKFEEQLMHVNALYFHGSNYGINAIS